MRRMRERCAKILKGAEGGDLVFYFPLSPGGLPGGVVDLMGQAKALHFCSPSAEASYSLHLLLHVIV